LLRLSESAERIVRADELRATLRAQATGNSAAAVQQAVNRQMAAALERARAIAGVTVSTGSYWSWRSGERGQSWTASQELRLSAIEATPALLELVGTLQGQGMLIGALAYEVSAPLARRTREEVTEEALAGLKARAERLAGALDMTFTGFREVRVDAPRHMPPPMPRAAMAARAEAAPPPSAEPAEVPIGEQIAQEVISRARVRPLAYFARGPRNLTSNRPIRTPDELSGLRLRVPNVPLFVAVWRALGARPTPMAFGEVFTSLQNGTIDAQENPLSLIRSANFNEVQRFVNRTEHARYDIPGLKAALARYAGIDAATLRSNLARFLREVVPAAEELGVRLCIHPDDPPRPLLGLPRIVSTRADLDDLVAAVPSRANGITFCTGSLGAGAGNDVPAMARALAPHVAFAHLRNLRKEPDGSFFEADHLDGDVDMPAVVAALLAEQARRREAGETDWRIPFRPDHGHQMLSDFGRRTHPGYTLIGRLRGLAELRGVIAGLTYRAAA
jgi:predicted secreted protein